MAAENIVWDLGSLYEGADDPRIEADKRQILHETSLLAERYKGSISTLAPGALAAAVRQYEVLCERLEKLSAFAYLLFSTRTQDSVAGAFLQSVREFESSIRRDTLFFELEWTQLGDLRASLLLSHPDLAHYRHYLETLRRYKSHMLTEAEERILAEKEPVCASSWNALFDKVMGALRFGDGRRTEACVLKDLYSTDRTAREQAAQDLTRGLSGVLHILTHIFNSILLDRAITDRLRKYPHWLSSRNLSNETEDRVVNALINAVTSRYDIVRRYYRHKRILLGYDELFDFDRYAPVPGRPRTDDILGGGPRHRDRGVSQVFAGLCVNCGEVFRRGLDSRHRAPREAMRRFLASHDAGFASFRTTQLRRQPPGRPYTGARTRSRHSSGSRRKAGIIQLRDALHHGRNRIRVRGNAHLQVHAR